MQIPNRINFQKITLGKLFQYEEIKIHYKHSLPHFWNVHSARKFRQFHFITELALITIWLANFPFPKTGNPFSLAWRVSHKRVHCANTDLTLIFGNFILFRVTRCWNEAQFSLPSKQKFKEIVCIYGAVYWKILIIRSISFLVVCICFF